MSNGSYGDGMIARWVGAVFYWVLSGCQKKLNNQLIEKYDMRNAWTGYLIYLIALGSLFYLIVTLST